MLEPQRSCFVISNRIRDLEKDKSHLLEICRQCTGQRDLEVQCSSLDCAVYYERVKVGNLHRSLEPLRVLWDD